MIFRHFWRGNEVEDRVTKKIEKFRFPSREELYAQSGVRDPTIPQSFLLMYATFYGQRDKANAHAPAHYNDAANVVNARNAESGVAFTANKITAAHHHDAEDIGDLITTDKRFYLPAALVYIDVVNTLLGPKTGLDYNRMLSLLTNSGKLLLEPVEEHFKRAIQPGHDDVITREGVIHILDDNYANFEVSRQRINTFYGNILRKWSATQTRVANHLRFKDENAYLSQVESQYIQDTISDFIKTIKEKRKQGEILDPKSLKNRVITEFERLKKSISEELDHTPRNLLFPTQSPTLLDIIFTIYRQNYLSSMYSAALEQSRAFAINGNYDTDHPDIAAIEIKYGDQRDVFTRLSTGTSPENKVSIGLKVVLNLEMGTQVVSQMQLERLEYERLQNLRDFLYLAAKTELREGANFARTKNRRNTRFKDEAEKLERLYRLVAKQEQGSFALGRISGFFSLAY